MARRDRPDHYSKQARREGYSARSVYKLEELQRRFSILADGMRVLDVGAAPGSWSQLTRKIIGRGGSIVAVDLSELGDLAGYDNVETITGDVFDSAIVGRIVEAGPYDAVISDAAPNTSGLRTLDTARSAALVEHVLWLCPQALAPGGNLVAKLFQGGEEQPLLQEIRRDFATGRLIKPKASRDESFETFLIGLGYGKGSSNRGTAQ